MIIPLSMFREGVRQESKAMTGPNKCRGTSFRRHTYYSSYSTKLHLSYKLPGSLEYVLAYHRLRTRLARIGTLDHHIQHASVGVE